MDKISVDKHPEMVALMMPGEDVNAFVKLAPGNRPTIHFVSRNVRAAEAQRSITIVISNNAEETLLRWFNHHLKRAGHHRQVRNFTSDIMVPYTLLIFTNK
jgi:hypothetical protein